MGRKKLYSERKLVAFPKGTIRKLKKIRNKGESLSDIIRMAIDVLCNDVIRCREVLAQDKCARYREAEIRRLRKSEGAKSAGA